MLRTATSSLRASTSRRLLSSSAHALPSAAYTDPSRHAEPGVSSTPDITPEQRQRLDAALRVDQAGEIAANYIYKGQLAVLGKHPVAGPLIQVSPFCGRLVSPCVVALTYRRLLCRWRRYTGRARGSSSCRRLASCRLVDNNVD